MKNKRGKKTSDAANTVGVTTDEPEEVKDRRNKGVGEEVDYRDTQRPSFAKKN